MLYWNENEEKIIGKFITSADAYMGHELLLKWPDGSQIRANYVSYIEDETDCDMDSADYEEFWSFVFEVQEVKGTPPVHVTEDNYFMVSYHNFPEAILADGVKINEQGSDKP